MRINNWRHVPWIVFVLLATIAACVLYAGNFYPASLPSWLRLPRSLIQPPTEHHTVGGTPLGLWFGSISLAIFIFAILLSLRKKIPLWRVGTVQRWLRAHIWLTILTIPLVILHSGFRLGGPMTTFLMVFYAIVMVSGFYGLFLQHVMPRLMKERLPAETVFEQIPHIRSQLAVAAEKMRDSFKPAPPKKPDAAAPAPSAAKTATAAAPVMASTKGELSTPVARAKSATGSAPTAAPVVAAAPPDDAESKPPPSVPNAAVTPAPPKPETIGTPTARVQSDPPGAPVARSEVPAGDQPAPSPPVAPPAAAPPAPPPKPAPPAPAKPAAPAAPKPAAKPAPPPDPASEAVLVEFIERQILPYLQAHRGDRMQLNNPRFSDDTFRFVKLRVAEGYRSRVEEIQAWCDERRMLDVQVRLHHWLHGWLFVHVPFSFLLVMLTIWHAVVTLFYY
ncbi:MAG TPA: hypothetical protein VE031_06490 [Chthoniobacterales bacterium]|nr:hypothetical protein [Chthoniobacterales bacterium]